MVLTGLADQPRPCAPRNQDKRLFAIASQKQAIKFAQPFLELGEAFAVRPRLHLGDSRRLVGSENVEVNVMGAASELGCPG